MLNPTQNKLPNLLMQANNQLFVFPLVHQECTTTKMEIILVGGLTRQKMHSR
jgi:hypothetical protein